MAYLVTTSLYPSDKAMEVAERYLEMLKEYPPDEALGTQVVPAASKTTHQGVKVLGVTEVKQGQLEAAMERVQNALAMFLNIPGFEYSIDIYATAAEAMATIGMKLPE